TPEPFPWRSVPEFFQHGRIGMLQGMRVRLNCQRFIDERHVFDHLPEGGLLFRRQGIEDIPAHHVIEIKTYAEILGNGEDPIEIRMRVEIPGAIDKMLRSLQPCTILLTECGGLRLQAFRFRMRFEMLAKLTKM